MQINVTVRLVDFKGKPIETGGRMCETCHRAIDPVAVTLRDVLINILSGETESDRNTDGAIKFKRYKLAQRIDKHDLVNLSAEEVTQLKERVAKFYTALVSGQVWELLDPTTETDEA